MKPVSRIRVVRKLILVAGDVLICFLSLVTALAWRQPELLGRDVFVGFVPLFAMWLGGFYVIGLYDFRLIRNFVSLVGSILVSAVVALLFSATYFYVLVPYLGLTPKTHLFIIIGAVHVLLFSWRRASLALFRFSLLDLKLVVLASTQHLEFLTVSIPDHLGDWLTLTEDADANVDLVVVDHEWIQQNPVKARHAFSTALARGVPVTSLDDFYEAMFGKVSPMRGTDLAWALTHVLPRSGSFYFKVKRLLDVVGAAILLILFSPILAVTGILIRAIDRMNPIYRQTRVGHLGRTFVLWKLQTIRPGSKATGPFSPGRETRGSGTTRLGGILRRLRLDELPQLWNVLRGDMSLVGPRPEWIKEVEVLETVLPTYHLRHLVSPGMTGWAQVYFRATSDIEDSIEKHHYDLYYVKNFSLVLDLSILLKTIKRVCVKDAGVTSRRYPDPAAQLTDVPCAIDITSVIGRADR